MLNTEYKVFVLLTIGYFKKDSQLITFCLLFFTRYPNCLGIRHKTLICLKLNVDLNCRKSIYLFT